MQQSRYLKMEHETLGDWGVSSDIKPAYKKQIQLVLKRHGGYLEEILLGYTICINNENKVALDTQGFWFKNDERLSIYELARLKDNLVNFFEYLEKEYNFIPEKND